MENLRDYAEEETPNTETRQMSRQPVIEEITAHSSELMHTIKGLKTELESVKKDNERILKTQEELNQILIENSRLKEKIEGLNLKKLAIKNGPKR